MNLKNWLIALRKLLIAQKKTLELRINFAASKLQEVPQRNKDLVFGYIRECEQEQEKDIAIDMIKYLCLIYLNETEDAFDKEHTNPGIEITGNTIHATGWKFNCYMKNIVNQGIHRWKFKCNVPDSNDLIGIRRANEEDSYALTNGLMKDLVQHQLDMDCLEVEH